MYQYVPTILADPCANVDCGDNGVCDGGVCVCTGGYTGDMCDTPSDPCANVDCGDNGDCDGGSCVCSVGFIGDRCNKPARIFICTFENRVDLDCMLSNAPGSSNLWEVQSVSNRRTGIQTGPSKAFTGDQFMSIEGQDGFIRSTLMLDDITGSGKYCLVLNYNMNGRGIVSLKVREGTRLVFHKRGHQGNSWITAKISLTLKPGQQKTIEGTSKGKRGNIAIDDVELFPVSCRKILTCSFEKNSQKCFRKADWKRESKSYAHDGYFLIQPRSISPTLDIDTDKFSGQSCLSFFYRKERANTGSLKVFTKAQGGNKEKRWESSTSDSVREWIPVVIPILIDNDHQVTIEASVSYQKRRQLSIDSLLMVNLPCP
ncbi:apical endosomal glycoprotein-like [Argopecten irradians]|uniref:apical endosomal glycoprotein-like n=1 Tax=Argopecten irradians TaxID=31199 RepID=UPI003719E67A